jgi:hypothetical protein
MRTMEAPVQREEVVIERYPMRRARCLTAQTVRGRTSACRFGKRK